MISLLIGWAAVIVAAAASGIVRDLLASIFRRPRKTSMFVEVDGKRIEVSGPSLKEVAAAIDEYVRVAGLANERVRQDNSGPSDETPEVPPDDTPSSQNTIYNISTFTGGVSTVQSSSTQGTPGGAGGGSGE
ncbi:hypothetical protein [Streptomyces avermitilis]|uniref:hypothetical protein n=1 Tax=Streptomyces avermitilis TaxID=33903 RepID=UPI0010F9D3AD|nr:hypothetical protein [Streptomyces avermitilis]